MSIRSVKPKEYSVSIAGKEFTLLPASIGMQNKIIYHFEGIEGKTLSFQEVWELIFPTSKTGNSKGTNTLALAHLAYCMIDFGVEKPDFQKFIDMLAHKKTEQDWIENALLSWKEAMPENFVKKKVIKKALASLTIMSAFASWLMAIWYLIFKIF